MKTLIVKREDLISLKRIVETLLSQNKIFNSEEIEDIKKSKLLTRFEDSFSNTHGSFLAQLKLEKYQIKYLEKALKCAIEYDIVYTNKEKDSFSILSLLHNFIDASYD